jgi:hypothetical protein
MSTIIEDGGRTNIYAKEPPIIMTDHPYGVPHNERAEKLNGRFAMIGIMAAFGAYAFTGQIIPGIW